MKYIILLALITNITYAGEGSTGPGLEISAKVKYVLGEGSTGPGVSKIITVPNDITIKYKNNDRQYDQINDVWLLKTKYRNLIVQNHKDLNFYDYQKELIEMERNIGIDDDEISTIFSNEVLKPFNLKDF